MTQFLIEHFVKDYEDVEKISVRTAYGVLASIVGIFCNVFLFAVKFTIGVIAHSVSVMADAFNNLSDAGSSIISFIGVKMAEKPADRDHPFGHGRIEYIAALVVFFSYFGSRVYFSERFDRENTNAGNAEFSDSFGHYTDLIDRSETVAWSVQQAAWREDKF